MSVASALPRWDMTVVYPSLSSPEFDQGFQNVTKSIADLGALFDELAIGQRQPAPLQEATVSAFERVITRLNDVLRDVQTLSAYISSFVSTDSRDNLAQGKQSELQQHTVKLSQLMTRFTAWIGSLDVEGLIAQSQVARDHAFALRQAKEDAAHLMSPAEEALAAELNVTGGRAWAKLHGNVTSQILVPIELDGETQELPMSAIRNLAAEPNRDVRRRAYEAELSGWQRVAVPLAAARNSIKGEVNTLASRRNWPSPLDAAIFDAN
ncbi:MAG: M3 family oligoendopeptidase, partial [Ktedonobacterales bacterium]